jgi:hypothetical protein
MPVTTCIVDDLDCRLEYQKDFSDNSYSGLLHGARPVLFSFTESVFIPAIPGSHQQAIKNAIKVHEAFREGNSGL